MGGRLAGFVAIADPIKETTPRALQALKAAGVLYPFFGLLLSPAVAATAMALPSLSVIGSSLRLRTAKVD